jgi:hypothetical protein
MPFWDNPVIGLYELALTIREPVIEVPTYTATPSATQTAD